jgi:hypothetical protein
MVSGEEASDCHYLVKGAVREVFQDAIAIGPSEELSCFAHRPSLSLPYKKVGWRVCTSSEDKGRVIPVVIDVVIDVVVNVVIDMAYAKDLYGFPRGLPQKIGEQKMPKLPSRIKYEQENPVVSFRLTKSLKETLDEVKGKRSYAETVKAILAREGYLAEEMKRHYMITVPCAGCGKHMAILPHSKGHRVILECLMERHFGHVYCQRIEEESISD